MNTEYRARQGKRRVCKTTTCGKPHNYAMVSWTRRRKYYGERVFSVLSETNFKLFCILFTGHPTHSTELGLCFSLWNISTTGRPTHSNKSGLCFPLWNTSITGHSNHSTKYGLCSSSSAAMTNPQYGESFGTQIPRKLFFILLVERFRGIFLKFQGSCKSHCLRQR